MSGGSWEQMTGIKSQRWENWNICQSCNPGSVKAVDSTAPDADHSGKPVPSLAALIAQEKEKIKKKLNKNQQKKISLKPQKNPYKFTLRNAKIP